jgi:serine/threonine protein kinase
VGGYHRLAYSTANKCAVKYLCLFPTDAPKDLIKKLLVVDPKKRLTVSQALGHPFFQVMVNILVTIIVWHNAAIDTNIQWNWISLNLSTLNLINQNS